MKVWKQWVGCVALCALSAHLALVTLYVFPFAVNVRDAVYEGTPFEQHWPLFSSYYPHKHRLDIAVACLNTPEPAQNEPFSSVLAPIWKNRSRSVMTPDRWTSYRVSTAFYTSYFRYARSQAGKREPATYAGYFAWLASQPDFDDIVHVSTRISRRHCGEAYAYADIRFSACPLTLWQPNRSQPCVTHTLGVKAL